MIVFGQVNRRLKSRARNMIKPFGNLLLVKETKVEDRTTSSGIVLMASLSDSPLLARALVLVFQQVFDGKRLLKGTFEPFEVV